MLRDTVESSRNPTSHSETRPTQAHKSISREDVEERLKETFKLIFESIAGDAAFETMT
jgi:hypothetical protein